MHYIVHCIRRAGTRIYYFKIHPDGDICMMPWYTPLKIPAIEIISWQGGIISLCICMIRTLYNDPRSPSERCKAYLVDTGLSWTMKESLTCVGIHIWWLAYMREMVEGTSKWGHTSHAVIGCDFLSYRPLPSASSLVVAEHPYPILIWSCLSSGKNRRGYEIEPY